MERFHSNEIGKYKIGDIIYKSPNSTVYECYDRESGSGKLVAKFVPIVESKEDTSRNESIMLSYFPSTGKSTNIVELLDDFQFGEFYVYIYPRYDTDLYEMIQAGGFKRDEEKLALVMYKIAKGINRISSSNIIHNDIKPENVFLNSNNEVFIGDFGSAYFADINSSVQIKRTEQYQAPESINGNEISFPYDVWSFGVLLYTAKKFEYPFGCPNEILFKTPRYYGINGNLLDLIKGCLIKDPSRRFKIQDVLKHQWFEEHHVASKNTLETDETTEIEPTPDK